METASQKSVPEPKQQASSSVSARLRKLCRAVLSRLLWAAVWVLNLTVHFQMDGKDPMLGSKQPVILSFWHNQILLATFFWRFRGIVVITSRHGDGELIAPVIRRFGYGTARGSSGRSGVRALLELKRHLAKGRNVAFTVDGPRGPRYRVKAGPIWLSARSGCPIVPFHIEPDGYWELNSWDRFRIPRPFTRARVCVGKPLLVNLETASESEWLRRYQESMDRLRNRPGGGREESESGQTAQKW